MNGSRFVNKNLIDALEHYQYPFQFNQLYFSFRSYEIHQKKLKEMKKELELKKGGKLNVIDEKEEILKMRIVSNKLKNHEFLDNEKIMEIQKQN